MVTCSQGGNIPLEAHTPLSPEQPAAIKLLPELFRNTLLLTGTPHSWLGYSVLLLGSISVPPEIPVYVALQMSPVSVFITGSGLDGQRI